MTTDPTRTSPHTTGAVPSADGRADDAPPFRYTAKLADSIETRWQSRWEAEKTFVQPNPGQPGFDASKPKFFCLDMFPYPSGAGLHVGHPEGYTATDIVSRFMRMKGHNVLHPMGWDAFGLPAEQYAIQTGIHPAITTKKSIETFRRQLKRFGFSYDWSREVATIDPEYYRWTQWIFLRAYNAWFDPQASASGGGKGAARPISELIAQLESGDLRVGLDGELAHIGVAGSLPIIAGEPVGTRRWHELSREEQRDVIDDQRLVYLDEATVNWCPALGTVLANDEVIDGRSERGGHPVVRKPLRQWMFRITKYAERLLQDLAPLAWPESTKTMQSEWIGKSEGAEIDFAVTIDTQLAQVETQQVIRVFTTRPDTVFGATFMVVAPEHPMLDFILNSRFGASDWKETGADLDALRQYVAAAKNRSEVDRMADAKEKTGVFTGLRCVNPATGESIPVWTADYVLMGYGHGAIMAVPAHDERDFAFAKRFGLPIRDVVYPRTLAAMAYFAERAGPNIESEPWVSQLADFLGLVTTASADTTFFPEVLEAVKQRREVPPPTTGPAAEHLTPRGSISQDWQATIKDFGFESLAQMRERFAAGEVFAHTGTAYAGVGFAAHSSGNGLKLTDLSTPEAKGATITWLEETGRGRRKVNYKLRDWAFSRQRYWGEPFPIVYDAKGNHYPVSDAALPVTLPELADYSPVESDEPQPLLAKAASWVNTTAKQAGVSSDVLSPETPVRRETNTMPGSAGSSWYFLRYCDAQNGKRFASPEAERYWMVSRKGEGQSVGEPVGEWNAQTHHLGGVDLYIGGSEHAVGHLLYSRFWHKVLFDLGYVSTPEPFGRLFHQGMITSYAYQRADKTLVPVDAVDEPSEGKFIERATGKPVTQIVAKMSKSLKNVINPDEIIAEFGADTFRLYEMYMGPLEASKPWNTRDTVGLFRFLQRAWRVAVDEQTGQLRAAETPDAKVEKQLHRTIAKVEADIPKLSLNTAIASLIEFVNVATAAGAATRSQLERFALVLAPFAPHMAEEIWLKLGHTRSLAHEAFPSFDPKMLVDDQVEVAVQINGKVKAKLMVATGLDKAALEAAAMADAQVKALLEGKEPKRVIGVPGRTVNIVL